MLGCFNWLMTDISRRKRSMADRAAADSGTISFSATMRPGLVVPAPGRRPPSPRGPARGAWCSAGPAAGSRRPRRGRARSSHWIAPATSSPESLATSRSGGASVPQPAQVIGIPSEASAADSIRLPVGERTSPTSRRHPVDPHPEDALAGAIWSPEPSRDRSTRRSLTYVPLVLPRSRSSHRGGLISIRKWSRDSAVSSGIGQWTNRDRPTMNVSWRSKTNVRPLRGPVGHPR